MTTQKQGDERLLKLAEFLETKVPDQHFDMSEYADGTAEDFRRIANGLSPDDCGSAACAAGWCPIRFPRDWTYLGFEPLLREGTTGSAEGDFKKYFFLPGLRDLFYPARDNETPQLWAAKARRFVASRKG